MLFIVSTARRSGPTQQLLNLCRFLPENGFLPSVLTLSPEPPDTLAPEFLSAGIPFSTLGLSRLEGLLQAKRRIRSVIAKEQPDLLHSQGIRGDVLTHSVRAHIPHVVTIRNFPADDYPAKFGAGRGYLMAWRHLHLVRKAQKPVACSQSLAERLRRFRLDIEAVPNGVDTDHFTPASKDERQQLRSKLHLPREEALVLHVGSLIPRKRPDALLNAYLRSAAKEHATLIFLGDGPMRAPLMQVAQGTKKVLFLGQVSNVLDYLRCADLLVSTSRSEGLPNSVLEALACGLPTLLSNIDSHQELGIESSGAGHLTDAENPAELAASLERILSSDRHALHKNARSLALEKFSARQTARRYSAVYDALISSNQQETSKQSTGNV